MLGLILPPVFPGREAGRLKARFPALREEKIDIALHYNKLSAQEPC
jgi:hypothetical protein